MINVKSEIMPLKKVLLHRPGNELLNLTPDSLGRLLFDDIPYLKVAREEHDEFAKILRMNGVEVVYLEDLMAEVLDIQSKAKYTYGQNQAYWYQNVIDTFSTQLPELAYGNMTAKEFCQKLTDAAKKN